MNLIKSYFIKIALESIDFVSKSINKQLLPLFNKLLIFRANIHNHCYFRVKNYFEQSVAGGTLMYLGNHLSNELRKDPSIHKSCELELSFTDISSPKKLML